MAEENKKLDEKTYTEAEVAELIKKATKESKTIKQDKEVKTIKVSRWGTHLAERGIK